MQQFLLPLFPLPLVLLPGKALPLHIFEERYKEMIGEALLRRSEFGVVQALEGGIVRTGCTAQVDSVLKKYDDGRMDILTVGRRRFVIDEVDTERSYLRAGVTFFDDDDSAPGALDLRRRAVRAFTDFVRNSEEEIEIPDVEEPQLSFVLAKVSDDLNFLQVLLGMQSEPERIGKVAEHLEALLVRQQLKSAMQKVAGTNGHGPRPRDLGQ